MSFNTPLTQLLGCRVPFVGAPMAGAAGGALAAAVSKAGGFGFIGIGERAATHELLNKELEIARAALGATAAAGERLPIGVGFLAWLVEENPDVATQVLQSAASQVKAVWLSFGKDLPKWYRVVREADREVKIIVVASTPKAAAEAAALGADIVVAQGVEAGGHGLSTGLPLVSLIPEAVAHLPAANRPVLLAAGGISSGAQAAAALALGADGFVVGTRLCATALVDADGEGTVRTEAYDAVRGTTGWPEGIDGRGIRNKTHDEFTAGRDLNALKADYEVAAKNQDVERLTIWAGSSVGLVKQVSPAGEVVLEFERQVIASVNRLAQIVGGRV
ncbi:hypothetical protein BKA62DRAFT_750319 [Auriculariales sp. MPI-PUGE-AT-0066]|nr:hypothetical protein BKA62DRAFT_750319 [Auriculariales sp. MPI-PUGE-AT-0066]